MMFILLTGLVFGFIVLASFLLYLEAIGNLYDFVTNKLKKLKTRIRG